MLAGGCNRGDAHACACTDGCPLSPAPTPATLVGLHLHTPPYSGAHAACTRVQSPTQPAHACNHPHSLHARAVTHTHAPARAPLPAQCGDAPSAPCLSPHPMWGAVLHAHRATHCGVQQGKGVLGRLGVTLSAATSPPAPPGRLGAPHCPTPPPREPGGCGEAQAPAQHYFLLSLWCRAEAWPGGSGCPPGPPRAAQVGAAGAAGWGVAGGWMWGSWAPRGVPAKPDGRGERDGSGSPCLAPGG